MGAKTSGLFCLVATAATLGCQGPPEPVAPETPDLVATEAATAEPAPPPPVDEKPPEPRAPVADNVVTMSVKDKLMDCTGAGPMKCMMVRTGDEKEFSYFYSPIEGFTFEEGFTYELKVEVTDVDNPPADASSKRYRLIEVISKTKVP